MRITEELHQVEDHEMIYEIMWTFYNAEISVAEPKSRMAMSVPIGFKIYKHENNCQDECSRLNRENRKRVDEMINKNR